METHSCVWCGAENVQLRCSLCKTNYYCDKKCQAKHWKSHKFQCSGYHPPRSINDYQFLEILGVGNFSEIIHVEEIRTQKQFALKKINKERVTQLRKQADVLMEKHVLNRLNDLPGVVYLYECFKDDLDLYFVTERVQGGELWEQCKFIGMAEPKAWYYLKQVIETLIVVHERGIVHRDLKTENILVTLEGKTKLIDFGTARDTQHPEVEIPSNSMRKKKFEHFVGTPHFMAPECVNNRDSTFKSDVWSLGCTMFFMLTGHPCFEGGSDYLIFKKSLEAEYEIPEYVSENARDFIERCLKISEDERPSMRELYELPYLQTVSGVYPIDSLATIAEKAIVEEIMKKYTEETAEEGITKEFEKIYSQIGETSRLLHVEKRLKSYFAKATNTNQQGI